MTAITIVLQWLHVLGAIFWFGTVLFSDFVLIPAVQGLPADIQRIVAAAIGARSRSLVTPISGIVVLLGFVRGLTGNVRLNQLFANDYNTTWLVALVLGIGLVIYGNGVYNPLLRKLASTQPGPAAVALLARIKTLALVELGLFLVIFTLMIAMRFGYGRSALAQSSRSAWTCSRL